MDKLKEIKTKLEESIYSEMCKGVEHVDTEEMYKAVHVGKLNIQPSYVLKLMNESIDFPNWITVLPDDEEIYVDLSRINIASGSRVRAKEIDLANDNILLEIVVPE